MTDREHSHSHDHDHDHDHDCDRGHTHSHAHSHESKKNVQDRLSRTIGHLQRVKRMVDDDEDCAAVLLQLSAVVGSLQAISKLVLTDHFDHCIVDAVTAGDQQTIDEFKKALERYIR